MTTYDVKLPILDCSEPCGTGKGTLKKLTYTWSEPMKKWSARVDEKIYTGVSCNRKPCCIERNTQRDPLTKKGIGISQYFNHKKYSPKTSQFNIAVQDKDLKDLKVGWYYNWSYCERFDTSVQYVPMQYSIHNKPEIRGRYKYLLGINEPDHQCQGRMTIYDTLVPYNEHTEKMMQLRKLLVSQCAHSKPAKGAPLKAYMLKTTQPDRSVWEIIEESSEFVGSPACASKYAVTRGKMPKKGVKYELSEKTGDGWLVRFTNHPAKPNYHFVCIHWYGHGEPASKFIKFLKGVYAEFQKPIWITEYAPETTGESTNSKVSVKQVIEFINETTKFFEETPWIHRYCWHNSYIGTSRIWDSKGRLTEVGKAYRDADAKYRKNTTELQEEHEKVYRGEATIEEPELPQTTGVENTPVEPEETETGGDATAGENPEDTSDDIVKDDLPETSGEISDDIVKDDLPETSGEISDDFDGKISLGENIQFDNSNLQEGLSFLLVLPIICCIILLIAIAL